MQTFLPYPRFSWSAIALDRLRLGKQRVECYQILRSLAGLSSGWRNHPAVKMWAGYETCLAAYGSAMCKEWARRGYEDNLRPKIAAFRQGDLILPPWLGDERLHSGHRARLLMKDPVWYGRHGWLEQPSDEYWWPV